MIMIVKMLACQGPIFFCRGRPSAPTRSLCSAAAAPAVLARVRAAVGIEGPLAAVFAVKADPVLEADGGRVGGAAIVSPEHLVRPPAPLHVQRAVAKVLAIKAMPSAVPDVGARHWDAFERNAVGSVASVGRGILPRIGLELALVGGILEEEGEAVQGLGWVSV